MYQRDLWLCILVTCLLSPCAWPQASTGTASGTVRDQTGAFVPNSTVTQTAVVDIIMQLAGTTTVVSVQDVTPVLATDNSVLGGTLERERIEQLPINGRQVTSLLQVDRKSARL